MPKHATTALSTALLSIDLSGSVLGRHSNQVTSNHAYTAFGYAPSGQGSHPHLGFNGQLRELSTGCYLLGNGYRAYHPVLMRFASADSLSPFGAGGSNAYGYVSGNPTSHVDPTGHQKLRTRTGAYTRDVLDGHAAFLKEHYRELERMDQLPYVKSEMKGWWRNPEAQASDLINARELVKYQKQYSGSMDSYLSSRFSFIRNRSYRRFTEARLKVNQLIGDFLYLAAPPYQRRDFTQPTTPYTAPAVPESFVLSEPETAPVRLPEASAPPPEYEPPPAYTEIVTQIRTSW